MKTKRIEAGVYEVKHNGRDFRIVVDYGKNIFTSRPMYNDPIWNIFEDGYKIGYSYTLRDAKKMIGEGRV